MPVSFEPGQIVHIYRIVRLLGEGGMGAVYEAVQDPIGRRVALKILHAQYASDPAVMNRFFNEARAVNIIAHPGLVQVSDFGRTPDGTAYLVMELLSGETLSSRIRHRRRLPVDEALLILQQLSSALSAAHANGIVHRDLKPSNVMLTPNPVSPSGEQVKIVDFGIAKLLDENIKQKGGDPRTETGKILGTPQYMAPEQAKSAKVDGKADVYAVGAMAFEMLSGRMPYQMEPGELVWALLVRKLTDPVPDLGQLDPTIPKEIVQLVTTLLNKEPNDRPTMAQLDSVFCRLLGFDPKKRSGIHTTVPAEEDPPTVDAPPPLPISQSPTVDDMPGASPLNLPSPPRPISNPAPPGGNGAVAEKMPSVSTAPIRASAQAPAATPAVPAAKSPTPVPAPASRIPWLLVILAVVVIEAIALAGYLTLGRPVNRPQGGQGRLAAPIDLGVPPDLTVRMDLNRPPDLAPLTPPVRLTEAKPKIEAPLRVGHSSRCAAVPMAESCIHGKSLSPAQRSHVLAAFRESKLRLCEGERMLVGRGESGVRVIEAPERLSAKLLKDFRLTLDGYLDASPLSGEIEILCPAPPAR